MAKETKTKKSEESTETKDTQERAENTIFIGKKDMSAYVLAVTARFKDGHESVTIKARGKLISTAVDVAEIVRRKYVQDLKVGKIEIKTEVLEGEGGRTSNVSSIEIPLEK